MTLSSNFTDLITIGGVAATTATGFILKNASNQSIQFGVAGAAGNFQNSSLQGDGVISATKGLILTGSYWSLLAEPTLTTVSAGNFSGNGTIGTVTVSGGTNTFPVGRFIILSAFSELGLNGPYQVTGGSPTTITIATIFITSLTYGFVTISNYTPTNMSGNITHTGSLTIESNIDEGDVEIVTPSITVSSLTTAKLVISDIVGTLTSVAGGTANQTLVIAGGIPTWQLLSLTASVSGVLPVSNGGTNLNSVGLEGQVLTTVAGVTAWVTPTTGGVTSVTASSPLGSSGGATPNISITSSTGTGAIVLANTPTLITPNIGAATATSISALNPTLFSIISNDTGLTSNGILLDGFRASLGLNTSTYPGGFNLLAESKLTSCFMRGGVSLNGSLAISGTGPGVGNLSVSGDTDISSLLLPNLTPTTLLLLGPDYRVNVVPTGTNGQVLSLVTGTPTWVNPGSTGVTSVTASSPLGSSGGATPNISITSSTGTGAIVLANTPTLITPNIGIATGSELSVLSSLKLNTSLSASTTSLNPKLSIFSTGGFEYGMDLGYSAGSSRYRTRLFAPNTADIAFSSAGTGPTLQSNYTDWVVVNGTTGAVTVSGTSILGGNTATRVFTASGVLSTAGNSHTLAIPAGVTQSNVISMSGVVQTAYLMAAFDTRDANYYWSFYFNNGGTITVNTGPSGTSVAGATYRITFITNS